MRKKTKKIDFTNPPPSDPRQSGAPLPQTPSLINIAFASNTTSSASQRFPSSASLQHERIWSSPPSNSLPYKYSFRVQIQRPARQSASRHPLASGRGELDTLPSLRLPPLLRYITETQLPSLYQLFPSSTDPLGSGV